jgi:divalent metal cation (Fe/Co/Zn/Cd) transporter
MKSRLSTRKLEDLIDKIEDRIRIEVPSVKYVQVELENHKDH